LVYLCIEIYIRFIFIKNDLKKKNIFYLKEPSPILIREFRFIAQIDCIKTLIRAEGYFYKISLFFCKFDNNLFGEYLHDYNFQLTTKTKNSLLPVHRYVNKLSDSPLVEH
jgi:hypothetical protein